MIVTDRGGEFDPVAHGLSDVERLSALRASAGGAAVGIAALSKRLSGLYGLLELELEDAPGAALYLRDSKLALTQIETLAAGMVQVARALPETLEPLNLERLISAADQRLQRIGQPGYALAGIPMASSPAIFGDLFLLEELFLTLPQVVNGSGPVPMVLKTALLDDGAAVALCIGAGGERALAEGRGLFDRPVDAVVQRALAVVAGIAAVHGGRVLAERNGDGYAVLFPQPAANAAGYDAADSDAELLGDETILLVDDESMIWDVVIDMLQSLGYTVILAGNGLECVEMYRDNPGKIDLVLLDMLMPEMNGREAFFKLRDMDPNVKVLLQSGYVAEADARDVLAAGARGFLRKPYRLVDLAARIREILS